jgi:hypothetical protein
VWDPDASLRSLSSHLQTLTQQQVTVLLTARHDASVAPVPKTMAKLAGRLLQPRSLAGAFTLVTLPQLQVAEAVAAVGDGCTPGRLAALLGVPEDDPDLAAALARLGALALVWPHGDGLAGAHLATVWPQPLGLGPDAATLLNDRPLADLRRVAKNLGVPAGRTKTDVIAALAAWLADPGNVRRLAERVPAQERTVLDELVWKKPPPFGMNMIMFGSPAPESPWAADHGLIVAGGWNRAGQMPREVALALRGADYHPPFAAAPPLLDTKPVPAATVDQEAAAAAAGIVAALTAVVETMSRTPVALLKSGGLGVRELRRIVKVSGQDEERVRLIIELVAAGGLVSPAGAGIAPAENYDRFAAAEPAHQLLDVTQTWLEMPACPYAPARPGEPAEPVLYWDQREEALLTGLRAAMLRMLAGRLAEGQATSSDALPGQLAWHAPVLADMAIDDLDRFAAGIWREAHEIGLLAHGAPTRLCRLILTDDAEATHAQAAAMMPANRTSVLLQADLTAVVTGTPSAPLLSLLDSAADAESRSGAWTWRFSAATVRRALDAGIDAQDLTARLTEAAEGGKLPQPLGYLIDDAARRHGHVQVHTVGCCLRSDDEALLAEILGTRSLKTLKLVRLAPTVLASGKPAKETLAALRAAGYAPTGVRADGTRAVERAPRHRGEPADFVPVQPSRQADPARIAQALVTKR